MAQLAAVVQVAGTILSTVGAIQQGRAAKAAAEFEAQQLEAQALTERASAQREAAEQRRQAELVASRARAVAAASGGGLDIPLLGEIAQEGEYRALTALWEGEERAKGRTAQATTRRFEGEQEERAGYLRGAATLLDGAGQSLMQRYG